MYHGGQWRPWVASTFHGSHVSPSSLLSVTPSTLYVVVYHRNILYVGTRVACSTIISLFDLVLMSFSDATSVIKYLIQRHWSVLLYAILHHGLDIYFCGSNKMIHYVFFSVLCTCIHIGSTLHLICGHALLSLSMGMPTSYMSFLSGLLC